MGFMVRLSRRERVSENEVRSAGGEIGFASGIWRDAEFAFCGGIAGGDGYDADGERSAGGQSEEDGVGGFGGGWGGIGERGDWRRGAVGGWEFEGKEEEEGLDELVRGGHSRRSEHDVEEGEGNGGQEYQWKVSRSVRDNRLRQARSRQPPIQIRTRKRILRQTGRDQRKRSPHWHLRRHDRHEKAPFRRRNGHARDNRRCPRCRSHGSRHRPSHCGKGIRGPAQRPRRPRSGQGD
mmetsp:Transcript_63815/g.75533  ORF Transcript_63815/g.75533 Transcript_63815/m.75533 type:complete len:236 (+) Transcript_63815:634-1341(+)